MTKATEQQLLEIRREAHLQALQMQIQNLTSQVVNLAGELQVRTRQMQDLEADYKALTEPPIDSPQAQTNGRDASHA